jgi:hypothetical protein
MRFSLIAVTGLVVALVLCAGGARAGQSMRMYSVGNSLTEGVNFPGLETMAESRGNTHVWGRHMQPGQTLDYIYNNPNDSGSWTQAPYGNWSNALANYTWDTVLLEPFSRPIAGNNGDLNNVSHFIDYLLPNSPSAQVYLYETWPLTDAGDYHNAWLGSYDGTANTVRTRDFYNQLMTQVRGKYASLSKPILMVPAGEVMYELNERMHAGLVPGYSDISALYSDGIHLNTKGSYLLAVTWYATMYRDDPHGLAMTGWDFNDPVLAAQIQDAAWQVVTSNPWTGVPEPASMGVIAILGVVGLTRRRVRA